MREGALGNWTLRLKPFAQNPTLRSSTATVDDINPALPILRTIPEFP